MWVAFLELFTLRTWFLNLCLQFTKDREAESIQSRPNGLLDHERIIFVLSDSYPLLIIVCYIV